MLSQLSTAPDLEAWLEQATADGVSVVYVSAGTTVVVDGGTLDTQAAALMTLAAEDGAVL